MSRVQPNVSRLRNALGLEIETDKSRCDPKTFDDIVPSDSEARELEPPGLPVPLPGQCHMPPRPGRASEASNAAQCNALGAMDPTLHRVVKLGSFEGTKVLLEGKVDVDAREHGQTALHLAASLGYPELVSLLLHCEADIDATDDKERTPLHLACMAPPAHEEAQIEEVAKTWNGWNQVVSMTMGRVTHRGSLQGQRQTVRHSGRAIEEEVMIEHVQVVALLLQMQANLWAMDVDGRTALHLAAQNTDERILSILLDHQARPWAPDDSGITPVDLGVETGALKVLAVFVEHGVKSLPILLKLLQSGRPESVELLRMWPEEAKVLTGKKVQALERAKLQDRLRTILAPQAAIQAGVAAVNQKWTDLSKQNLVFNPEVQACLKVLPGLNGSNIWECELLDAFADASNLGIFQTNVVEAIISAAWQQVRVFISLDIAAALVTVVALSFSSHAFRTGGALSIHSLLVAAALHLKLTLEEIWQHLTTAVTYALRGKHYFILDFDNLFDFGYLAAGWVAILRQLWNLESLEKPFMSLYCGMSWLRILWILRGESWMGPGLLPILFALKDTAAFFIVTITSLLAATHAYYNLQIKDDPSPFYGAFLTVVRLGIFGDYDLLELEGLTPTLMYEEDAGGYKSIEPDPGPNYTAIHGLYYMIGMGITVLLMNLLIGVLGQNFHIYQDQSTMLYLQARAKMLRQIRDRPWRITCLRRKRCKETLSVVDMILLCPFTIACFPLYPVLRTRFAPVVKQARDLVRKYHAMALLLCIVSPICWVCSTGLLLAYLVGGIFLSLNGMSHALVTTLGWYGCEKSESAHIWLIIRETLSDDGRSMRSYLKMNFKSLKDALEDLDAKTDLIARSMPKTTGVSRRTSGELSREVAALHSEIGSRRPSCAPPTSHSVPGSLQEVASVTLETPTSTSLAHETVGAIGELQDDGENHLQVDRPGPTRWRRRFPHP